MVPVLAAVPFWAFVAFWQVCGELKPVISISVFGYWKVSFYPLNTDTDDFYEFDTDMDTEANYPKFCTEILKNTSIFQYHNDCLKPIKKE